MRSDFLRRAAYAADRATDALCIGARKMRDGDQPSIFGKCREFTEALKIKMLGKYPYFRTISSAQDTEVIMLNGKRVVMLGSNSYLALTNDPRVKEAAKAAIDRYGTGCAGSPFLNGRLDIHVELEEALARMTGKKAALLYSTGFQANLGTIGALVEKGEFLVADKSDHASIYEGGKSSEGGLVRYNHNDMASLESKLKAIRDGFSDAGILIVTDGVFSMEGDIANLPEICRLSKLYKTGVMVDDAHSIGVLGDRGRGTANHFGLTDDVDLIMGTASKSFAGQGGFVAGNSDRIDYLRHHSRALIFSASMPPSQAATILKSLEIMLSEPERIDALWRNTARLKEGLKQQGFYIGSSETPIVPVYVGEMMRTFNFCNRLQDEGVFVNPVISPAVAPGKELLRLSLMANHTPEQIDFAVDKIKKVGKKLGVI